MMFLSWGWSHLNSHMVSSWNDSAFMSIRNMYYLHSKATVYVCSYHLPRLQTKALWIQNGQIRARYVACIVLALMASVIRCWGAILLAVYAARKLYDLYARCPLSLITYTYILNVKLNLLAELAAWCPFRLHFIGASRQEGTRAVNHMSTCLRFKTWRRQGGWTTSEIQECNRRKRWLVTRKGVRKTKRPFFLLKFFSCIHAFLHSMRHRQRCPEQSTAGDSWTALPAAGECWPPFRAL